MSTCVTWIGLNDGARPWPLVRRAVRGHERTIVVELDLARGDLAWRSGIDARTTLADLAAMPVAQVGSEAVAAVTWRSPDGIDVVVGPCCPELAEVVTPELLAQVLGVLLSAGSDVHVVATGPFDARVLEACRRSNEIVLFGDRSPHVAHVDDRITDLLERCGIHAAVRRVQRAHGFIGMVHPLANRVANRSLRGTQPNVRFAPGAAQDA